MAAMDGDVFLYEKMTPLGDAELEVEEDGAVFLPLGSAGSRRDGRSLQSLIAAEKDLLAGASTTEFKARADTSGSGDLGVSSRKMLSPSRMSSRSAVVEENADFIPLDMSDVETVVEEVSLEKRKREETLGSKEAPPWARGRESWIHSPLLQLHQEIVDFCEFVAPTEEEQRMRDVAVQRVSAVVKSIWPSCQVKVFGSFATGLYLPTSDVDIVVLDSGCQAIQDGLKAISKALRRGNVGISIQVIAKARVPIIKFIETTSNIPFDISFDVANGPEAADFIKVAMGAIPPLRPLCLVLKIFLQQRELNEVYQGGIGSYALLVMILTHLQMHPSKRRVSSRGQAPPLETNLGILLVDFLDLYGRTLNMKDVGVSCRDGGRFFRKRERRFGDSKRPFLLSVEDPQSPQNDIGKNSYAIQKVRSAFMMAHRLLTTDDADSEVGLLSRIVRMDAKLVGRTKASPALLPFLATTPPRLPPANNRPRHTFIKYVEAEDENENEDRYVPGDGTFSNSDSDDAVPNNNFKTPESRKRSRGRWHDYEEEEEENFPRVQSADGYLSKKAKKAMKFKERVEQKDDEDALFGRYAPKESSKNRNRVESEEGEVKKLGRRARKREELMRWKAEKLAQELNMNGGLERPVGDNERNQQHPHRNGNETGSSRSTKVEKYSRYKEEKAKRKRESREAAEYSRRIVVTKPAHKKIKYM